MSRYLASRRRSIARNGRPMTLRRQNAGLPPSYISVGLPGTFTAYAPEQLTGGVQQGDARVEILNDEIAAAAWPGPPRSRDSVLINGATWIVQGAYPVYDAALLIGYEVWIRGGSA